MRPCGNCGGPLPDEARFCNHCGQTVGPPAAPRRTGSMRVCGTCGVIAPTGRAECSVCGGTIANAPTVQAREDGNYWACVLECDFACRACGMRSPLDGLDLDGTVECRRCGVQQTFDLEQWDEVLNFAEDVADCAGPPGRLGKGPVDGNPYAEIGVTHTFAEKTLSGMIIDGEGMKPRNLRLRATPGVPLCERCHVPLDVQIDREEWKAQASCPRCHDRAVYDTPEGAFERNGDIAAVLADDHRCDREPVHVHASPGGAAVAIACPRCDAALPVAGEATMVTCGYCGTPCRIPSRLLGKLASSAPKPKRWWILFDDDSYQRLGVDPDADDDDDDSPSDHDEKDDADAFDRAFESGRMARVRAAQAAEAQARAAQSAPKPTNGPAGIAVALAAVAVLGAAGVVFSIVHGRANPPAAEASEPKAPAEKANADKELDDKPDEKAAAGKAKPLDRSKFKDLKGCTCKSGKDTRQLAVRIDVEGMGMTVGQDDGFVANFDLSWLADSGGKFFLLHDEEASAPPRKVKGRALPIGVACGGDVFVVIARDHATGWSIKDQQRLWDTALDAEHALAATPSKTGLSIQCAAIPVNGKVLRVPLAKGKSQPIDVTTGAPAK
ncbi:MAG: zinc ribbon domain-containing protein [Deltaproteobacteria bacterium]|nr:zinc ribbon domain-containing protein [Deltaproteobacteria bacterium]